MGARLLLAAIATLLLTVLCLRLYTVGRFAGDVYDVSDAPRRDVAIVFGAGVWANGEPTPVLYDRIATAAELYRQGKVMRLLMTGDGRLYSTHEPDVMRETALGLGVPDEAILRDDEGLRTYQSCRRARSEFGIASAILVTQAFHLPRALLLCGSVEIAVAGVASDRRDYPWRWNVSWQVRETAATLVAWRDVIAAR